MPNFIEPDLHINDGIPTNLERHATPISGIEVDIDSDIRNPTSPDIGADRFNGHSWCRKQQIHSAIRI